MKKQELKRELKTAKLFKEDWKKVKQWAIQREITMQEVMSYLINR